MKIFNCQAGGIQLRIVFAIVTFIGVALFLGFFISKKSEVAKEDHRIATLLSDKGLQIFMESTHQSLLSSPLSVKGIEKEEYEDGWFEVNVSASLKDSLCSVVIESIGGSGKSRVSQEKTIKLIRHITETDTAWSPSDR